MITELLVWSALVFICGLRVGQKLTLSACIQDAELIAYQAAHRIFNDEKERMSRSC